MKLGEKIKYLRKSKGISQEELATMLKINRNFLSRIETGKSDPNAGILKSIAQIFNVDLNSLLDINNSEEQGIDKIHNRKLQILTGQRLRIYCKNNVCNAWRICKNKYRHRLRMIFLSFFLYTLIWVIIKIF